MLRERSFSKCCGGSVIFVERHWYAEDVDEMSPIRRLFPRAWALIRFDPAVCLSYDCPCFGDDSTGSMEKNDKYGNDSAIN